MSKFVACRTCDKEIAKSAASCPHCGARREVGGFRRIFQWVVGFFFIIIVINVLLTSDDGSVNFPDCDSSTAHLEVAAAMEGAPMGRVLGLKLIKISDAKELSASDKERKCRGMAQLSNAKKHPISYKFYMDAQNDVMIEARVEGL